EESGVGRGARTRSYPDPRGTAELVVALGRFEALVGVRSADEIRGRFAAAAVGVLEGQLPATDADVPALSAALPRSDPGPAATAVDQARRAATDRSDPPSVWLSRLAARHEHDAAALAPLFLHHVDLAAGEALVVTPGQVHVYLGG